MVTPTLSETEHECKSLNPEQLLTLLEQHPAMSPAFTMNIVSSSVMQPWKHLLHPDPREPQGAAVSKKPPRPR
jgi:hypothetical protein